MEEGFVKGQSDNLPKIDIYTVSDFFSSNPSYISAEIKGVKLSKACRESYRDEAVGYVQVKREGNKCTVKCRISPEHKVKSKPYHCTLVCDESEEKVESVVCHDCAANQGGCKHTVAFLMWLFKISEAPATTSVKCYWMKPALSNVGSNVKFIKAKDFNKDCATISEITEDNEFCNTFISECKKRNANNIQIMTYFKDVNLEMKASLHYLICKYKSSKVQFSLNDFITFCKQNITEKQCNLIEKATSNQSDSPLWFELRYGRITASIAHEASKCKTSDGVLVEKILGAYQFKEPIAMQRGKRLENDVRREVEKIKNINIKKCGLFLLSEYPLLGASPDGITEDHIIEIKCPMKNKNLTKYINSNNLTPKCEAQVQLQMHFAKKRKAYFCIAHDDFETSKQVDVFEVFYNEEYCKNLIKQCTLFWKYVFDLLIVD
ncbi:uncharacterized protein [Diabrotica undecimpunctata]|uniref:uncharacterized protein n=1 Tax=Diabrotica undecimpunctata TaxID=50387 RepID=UPI003B633E10